MAAIEITTTPIKIFDSGTYGLAHASHGYPFLVKQTDVDQTGKDAQSWRLIDIGDSVESNQYPKNIWVAARTRDADQGVVRIELDT